MTDYSKAVIYIIITDDGLYVGSTYDLKKRKIQHKSRIYNENEQQYNCKLYKNIRANDGEYRIELYKLFPCENGIELRQEEDRVMLELNANLNERRAYRSEEERKEYYKEYRENNRDRMCAKKKLYYENNRDRMCARMGEIVICECGCESQRGNLSNHRKSKKHLNRMKEIDDCN